MLNVSLMRKFQLLTLLFAMVASGVVGWVFYSTSQIDQQVKEVAEIHIPVLNKAHQLKLAVVQVQQWLTDISATRGLDGLNDGFDEAKANAEIAKQLLVELAELDATNRSNYQDIANRFDNYYQVGQEMAKAYVNEGPAGGNAMMASFDEAAAELASRVDPFLEKTIISVSQIVAKQRDSTAELVISTLIGFLMLVIVMGLIYFSTVGMLAALPKIIKEFQLISLGDLRALASKPERKDEIGEMYIALDSMKRSLKDIIAKVGASSGQLTIASTQLVDSNNAMNANIAEQSQDVSKINHIVHEITESAAHLAENSSLAQQAVTDVSQQTDIGRAVIGDAVEAIEALASEVTSATDAANKLSNESESIGSILDVIRSVAEQTNLLALNAAIEAARAGEQGRGFAVVADEVRTLAQRSQKSTEDIQKVIEGLQRDIRDLVFAMEHEKENVDMSVSKVLAADESFKQIISAVKSIEDMNSQIATVGKQLSSVSQDLRTDIDGIKNKSDQNVAASEQIGTASSQLQRLALELDDSVVHFKVS